MEMVESEGFKLWGDVGIDESKKGKIIITKGEKLLSYPDVITIDGYAVIITQNER